MTQEILDLEKMMSLAIATGEKGRITAPPNPFVGCILVKNGKIIGEGFSAPAGQAHAEIRALQQAGEQARGATAFVTLEPCCHHGRTPPCTLSLISAGISKVYVALLDPDKRVSGKGVEQLRQAGIDVEVGLFANKVEKSLEAYLHQRRTKRPYCIAKAAITIDGKIAAADGTSQWISSPQAREQAHQLRLESQAVLIGSGTALKDNPQLTVRNITPIPRQPLRVILDSRGRVPPTGALFDTSLAKTLVITSAQTTSNVIDGWKSKGAFVETVASNEHGLDLLAVLEVLNKYEILQVLIEGGSTLLNSFLKAKLIDRLKLYVGPYIFGQGGIPLFPTHDIKTITEAPKLHLEGSEILGDTVCLDYKIK